MMKRPKSVEVLGKNYSIAYTPVKEMEQLLGDISFEDKVIRIRNGLSDVETHNTLLHEIIHAVLYDSGMKFLMSGKMEEALTRALENGLGPLVTLNCTKRTRG